MHWEHLHALWASRDVRGVWDDGVQVAQLAAMGATLYQPGQQVQTNFVGFLDGMSSDGVKFVSVRGELLCTPTKDTEVHDALLAAAQEVCAGLLKRKRRV